MRSGVVVNVSKIQTGAIFPSISRKNRLGMQALTPLSVNLILKKCAKMANLVDLNSLSSHSLRRGLATSAARAEAPLQVIMQAGRWKHTNTVMEYIEASQRFNENAASRVLMNFNNSLPSNEITKK